MRAFSPSAPIASKALFAGRHEQMSELINIAYESGQHAVIYGERGVGKTSLARVMKEVFDTPTAWTSFVRGIACGDVVATEPDEEGVGWAGEVVRRSENCAIRLIVLRDGGSGAARQSVINAFKELGVDGEGIEPFRMVALDVPPTADLAKVQRLLNHGVGKEWWDMEEGCITVQWRAASAS